MSPEQFKSEVKTWFAHGQGSALEAPLHRITYQPMQEGLPFFRPIGFKTYIVTGGGQDFVRPVCGGDLRHPARTGRRHAEWQKYGYDNDGRPMLTKEPKILLNDNYAGKPEGIHLMIGRGPSPPSAIARRPADARIHRGRRRRAAVDAGLSRRCHGEYAYGPAQGLPDSGSAPSRKRCMTRQEERVDGHQHEKGLEENLWVQEVAGGMDRLTVNNGMQLVSLHKTQRKEVPKG